MEKSLNVSMEKTILKDLEWQFVVVLVFGVKVQVKVILTVMKQIKARKNSTLEPPKFFWALFVTA